MDAVLYVARVLLAAFLLQLVLVRVVAHGIQRDAGKITEEQFVARTGATFVFCYFLIADLLTFIPKGVQP